MVRRHFVVSSSLEPSKPEFLTGITGYYCCFSGAPDSTIRQVFPAPTAARPSTTASSTSPTAAAAAVSLTSADPSRTSSSPASYPDPCHTSLDAISVIRGQLIAFKSNVRQAHCQQCLACMYVCMWWWYVHSCHQLLAVAG